MSRDDERAGGSAERSEAAAGDAAGEDGGAAAADPAPDPAPAPSPRIESRSGAVATPRAGAGAVAWLAVGLALLAAAVAVWGLLESERRQAAVLSRLAGLEAVAGRDGSALEQLGSSLGRQVELQVQAAETALRGERQEAVDAVRRRLAEVADSVAAVRSARGDDASARAALAARLGDLEEALSRLGDEVDGQQRRLDEFRQISSGDRDSWLLAEAHYLLRLANQRLLMSGDTGSAAALLESADGVLRDLDDPVLLGVREAIAGDLAAVRAVPQLDREGTYLRLASLVDRIDDLVVLETPAPGSGSAEADADAQGAGDWRSRLRRGFERALAKLSGYITVRRREEPVEVLMDPQWERLVRQNLRLLLEQAQVALLSGNGRLYRESLDRAVGWVEEFRPGDARGAAAMIAGLASLGEVRVSVDVPDASASLAAMQAALEERAERSEAGAAGGGA